MYVNINAGYEMTSRSEAYRFDKWVALGVSEARILFPSGRHNWNTKQADVINRIFHARIAIFKNF